jgi:hypothetical protein
MDKMDKMMIGGMAAAVAVVMLLVGYFMIIPYMAERSWGADGDLDLGISADKATMALDDVISVTYTLTNTGDTDLRVIADFGPWGPPVSVMDSNGDHVEYIGPMYSKEKMSAGPPDYFVLKAGKSKSFTESISGNMYELRSNETYQLLGHYTAYEDEIPLPHWVGELESNAVFFDIV